jgi:hypothetical protein
MLSLDIDDIDPAEAGNTVCILCCSVVRENVEMEERWNDSLRACLCTSK